MNTQSNYLEKPSLVNVIAWTTLASGIVNLGWGLVASATALLTIVGICCTPLTILPAIIGIFEIIYAAKLLSVPPQPVRPAINLAILEIVCILTGNVFSMMVGIISLVFYNDQVVKEYFARLNGDLETPSWLFGVRRSRSRNHAELALRCALNMIRRVEELRLRWAASDRPELFIGIGLNTGEVIVGNVGAEGKKMDYTVIGDPVNLGARVESLTRTLGCHLLITDATLGRIRDTLAAGGFGHLTIAGRGEVSVKGKKTRVSVFQVDTRAEGTGCALEI